MKLTPKMEELVEKVLADMKNGQVPWDKPWFYNPSINWLSKRPYQGMNVLSLAYGLQDSGLKTGQFLTYNQAFKNGGTVKKGSHGFPVCFFSMIETKDKDGGKSKFPLMKTAIVFSIDQIDGIKPRETKQRELSPNNLGDKIIKLSGADIRFNDAIKPAPAFCKNDGSYIEVPHQNLWKTDEAYYSTVFHELIHWTGSKGRISAEGRKSLINYSTERAMEELTAEIGAAFLASYVGFKYDTQHMAYIQSWVSMMTDKADSLYKASSQAQKAVNYLLTLSGELKAETVQEEELVTA